jgi:hypothetical protein
MKKSTGKTERTAIRRRPSGGGRSSTRGLLAPYFKNLTVPSTDALMRKLIEIAEPPLERLETITRRLVS